MSASDLAPFVAAVIEDGIVAELQRKNKELQSKIHTHESERLLVQITGRGGHRIYGECSLKDCGSPIGTSHWGLDIEHKACVCPFDEESVTQLEIRLGGIVLPSFNVGLTFGNDLEPFQLCFDINSFKDNKSPVHTINGWLGLAASSSTLMDDKKTFKSLMESLIPMMVADPMFQLDHLLHHFDTLINTDDEQGIGTKLTMTFETIEFRKDSISGCMSLMDKLGVQTTDEDD